MGLFDGVRATMSFVRLSSDLDRLDEVFTYAQTLMTDENKREGVGFFSGFAWGQKALGERHRLGTVDLEALARLPQGTLGREFADHMKRNGLDLAAIPDLPSRDEGEFIFAHFYETHDIWHVVTGFATDKAGELGLQAFYLAQGGPARLSAMILSAGFLELLLKKGAFEDREARLFQVSRGYVMGKKAKPLFGVRWDDLWEVPLDEVRRSLGVDVVGATHAVS